MRYLVLVLIVLCGCSGSEPPPVPHSDGGAVRCWSCTVQLDRDHGGYDCVSNSRPGTADCYYACMVDIDSFGIASCVPR